MGTRGPKPLPRAERFWMRVDKTGECWLWTGPTAAKRGGYGHFYDDGAKLRRAHRVAWEITQDVTLTPDVVLMHTCDTPLCVRPDHLRAGTQAENLADMRAKGRHHAFTREEIAMGNDANRRKAAERRAS